MLLGKVTDEDYDKGLLQIMAKQVELSRDLRGRVMEMGKSHVTANFNRHVEPIFRRLESDWKAKGGE